MDKATTKLTCRIAQANDLATIEQWLAAVKWHAHSSAWLMHHTNNIILAENEEGGIAGFMIIWQSPVKYLTAVIDHLLTASADYLTEVAHALMASAHLYAQQKCLRTIVVNQSVASSLPEEFWKTAGFLATQDAGMPWAQKVMPKHICLDGKKMRPSLNTLGGQISEDTIFEYHQEGDFVWGTYHGGDVKRGVLVGKMTASRDINFFYMQLDQQGTFHQGTSKSSTEYLNDGRLVLFEDWVWTGNRKGEGTAIIEEIKE